MEICTTYGSEHENGPYGTEPDYPEKCIPDGLIWVPFSAGITEFKRFASNTPTFYYVHYVKWVMWKRSKE